MLDGSQPRWPVRFVHGEANNALHGTYSEQTGRVLFSAVAQATRLAGSMAADVLTHMSRLAVQISQGAKSDDDALHDARYAVSLVRTARSVAEPATPILTTQMHAVEARGLALLGDVRATTAAADSAISTIEEALGGYEPWRMRSRAFAQTDLAMTYLAQGEIAGTRIAAEEALRIADTGCLATDSGSNSGPSPAT